MTSSQSHDMTFGIYACSQVGAATGRPDDPAAMLAAIDDLRQ